MPFLRFSRDARGYESTYLCHTFRRSSGPPELRVLYWFRSPPDVKVGRAALAPDVIREIEESNPGLRFDWDKILKVKPPPPPDPGREEREERRNRRRRGKDAGGAARPAPAEAPRQARAVAPPATATRQETADDAAEGPDEVPPADGVTDATGNGEQAVRHVALAVTDEEGLARLRARHAEIQTRIGDRFRDPARLEELRKQASELDPDGWSSVDEARERIASLDETTAALRKILGRRRRTRRGGARRRRGPTSASGGSSEGTAQARPEADEAAPAETESASDADPDPSAT